MSTPKLTIWEFILFFFGMYKPAPPGSVCSKCKKKDTIFIMDLGDDDFICTKCWDEHPNS